MNVELLIENNKKLYAPIVEEGIEWTTERKGAPGKLTFNVVKDELLNFTEGNAVRLRVDNKDVFYGFVFSKKRGKGDTISVTAYDQLRYLKNKDTYNYSDKTASELIKMIAADFNLKTGTIEDTGFKIAFRNEINTTLFDIILNALDLTLTSNKQMYVLYDDFGKLTLKNISSMAVNMLIDKETAENFSYTSSIDTDTYNKIRLTYENDETSKTETYETKDTSNINRWGVLQYHDTIQAGENGQAKADALLALYNKKTRSLDINNVFGDTRVRAGSLIAVRLGLGDINLSNMMLVEKCRHKFKNGEHFMDLTLRGGDINA